MNEYALRIPNFEGPFDLLLDLVSKHKISIYDISITEIIDQYIQQVSLWQEAKMDFTGEFIVMAAHLLEIKSRYMLYLLDEEEEEDPSLEIRHSLELYQQFKEASEFFQHKKDGDVWYTRPGTEVFVQETLNIENLTLELLQAYKDRLFTKKREAPPMISFRIIPVQDKMLEIRKLLFQSRTCYFKDLTEGKGSDQQVVSLLSLLEMMKLREVKSLQEEIFGDILIERQEEANGNQEIDQYH